ncbi:phage head-tail connector protein [Bacillus sp. CLL-7-23]|uniref:Phage head-tail connector protein n=1 Tax=Bacillus changyiensis TaxID=3004103 RepID=A0ABT4X857_9BACI|nr:phage head-tail connector protein [Bacillus changyiensis]MDA7028459.1 phage head-tail connector protein [Bacillus changyiensis]
MDIQTIKTMLRITTNKHDDYFKEVIPIYMDYAKTYCNNTFTVDGQEVLPAGVKLFVAKAIEFNMNPVNLSSRNMGDASYSYVTELPETIMRYLKPYKKLRFV